MTSTILTYSKSLSDIGSPNGKVIISSPLRFNSSQKLGLRLIKASFSSQIPNIWNSPTFNNGLIRLTRNGGTSWTNVQLPNGIYTCSYIQSALNTAVSGWWKEQDKPGIICAYNMATQLVYFTLDSSTLIAPGTQLGIDLGQSYIWDVLGYENVKSTIVDGVWGGDKYPKLDYFGNNVSITLDGFGPLSIRNGALSTEICSVPLSTTSNENEVLYPKQGIISPMIQLSRPPPEVFEYKVNFYGSRIDPSTGIQRELLIMEGMIEVVLELTWTSF